MKKIKKFKALKQFKGKYLVSQDGRVFKKKNGKKKEIKQFVAQTSERTRFVRLFKDGKSASVTVGRMVLMTFNPTTNRKAIAVHIDGNPENVGLDNLKWGTRKMQSEIAMKNPIHKKRVRSMGKKYGPGNGKKNGKLYGKQNLIKWRKDNKHISVVTPEMVKEMKRLLKNGMSRANIAKSVGLHRSTIYNYV